VELGFHPPPGRPKTLIFIGRIARCVKRQYISYSEGDFEVHSSVPNFTPIGATIGAQDQEADIFTEI